MTKSELLKKANELPMKPGVYMMKDVNGTVIYVGKAKILKNRVVSYFRNGEHTEKTRQMVSRVDRFDVIICASELDALLTECSLIKRYVPLYNIALKNGNGYPFIRFYIDKGFPVLTTERFKNSKGKYFCRVRNAIWSFALFQRRSHCPTVPQKPDVKRYALIIISGVVSDIVRTGWTKKNSKNSAKRSVPS
mgnify:CR=1 FL=1